MHDRALVVCACLLTCIACQPPAVAGIVDGVADPPEGDPAAPRAYAVGATMYLWAQDASGRQVQDYELSSSDPSVFRLVPTVIRYSPAVTSILARASAPGTAVLSVLDLDGHVLYAEPVEVRTPTSARLYSTSLLATGSPPADARVTSIWMLTTDSTSLRAALYDGDVALRSEATFDTATCPCATATGRGGSQLAVASSIVGEGDLSIAQLGVALASLHVTVEPHSAVADVGVVGPTEVGVPSGKTLELLASARDTGGHHLETQSFTWSPSSPGSHGGFEYAFDAHETLAVETTLGPASTTTTVHGHALVPHVLVCAVGWSARPTPALLAAAFALSLFVAGRRRRSAVAAVASR